MMLLVLIRCGSMVTRIVSRLVPCVLLAATCWYVGPRVMADSDPHALGTNWTSGIKTDKRHCPCGPLDEYHRAGNPQRVSKIARRSNTFRYGGYYVGGGSPWHGEPRQWIEGTWSCDYWGHLVKRRISLRWYHGRKCQGGAGSYEPDGPNLRQIAERNRAATGPR